MSGRNIVVAVGGSSGSLYAKVLFDRLRDIKSKWENVGVVLTENGKYNWQFELGNEDWKQYPFTYYGQRDFMAPFASGSARYDTMIVCPCSMGLMARIAGGISNDLITRAADVVLKERRRLIVVPREAPYSLIHLKNMVSITEAGGVVCPAVPSFYNQAETAEEIVRTIVDRVLDLAGFDLDDTFRWGDRETHDDGD
ncbi:4-hydroxy-3-polyprenylbenzoate decarboxylase [Neolewinella xylanilytica]|uniref:Flavin prenyltransferase UbiX n=1 Tax=Neolewinella xylanilytica TaxID=1514080 RepID=A0A2S6I612_9BACT|nr:UbiX family flavin prenyltransferase [Neolewinella xylanilytica]PPK86604.1 4-hydroxy-3-polyprenylbenzoate decarboxylase [Neolewinella xylanilytica]